MGVTIHCVVENITGAHWINCFEAVVYNFVIITAAHVSLTVAHTSHYHHSSSLPDHVGLTG